MSGPKAKATALHQAQGNPGHRGGKITAARKAAEAAAVAPPAPVDQVEPPKWLAPATKRIFRTLAPNLRQRMLLGKVDAIAFARYVQFLERYLNLEKKMRGGDIVHRTKTKYVEEREKLSGDFSALVALDKRLMDYEDRFGMSPKARNDILAKLASTHSPHSGTSGDAPRPPTPENDDDQAPQKVSAIGFLRPRTVPKA